MKKPKTKNFYKLNPDGTASLIIQSEKYGDYEVILDREDLERTKAVIKSGRQKWNPHFQKGKWLGSFYTSVEDPDGGVINKKHRGKEWTQKRRKMLYLHRFLVSAPGSTNVIHLNENYSDCRKENLKPLSREEFIVWENERITEDLNSGKTKKMIIPHSKHGDQCVYFDSADWDFVKKYKWSVKFSKKEKNRKYVQTQVAHPSGGTNSFYCRTYKRTRTSKRTTYLTMHRLMLNPPKNYHIDHVNNNGLDNRRKNLRICTPAQNSCNRNPNKNSAVPYKGVKLSPSNKLRFQSQINHNKKRYHLGVFETAIAAAEAHDIAALKFHGDYAKLNFPEKLKKYLLEIRNEETDESR